MAITRTELADILDALEEVRERYEMLADVEDGPDGEQYPNKAMRVLNKIERAIALADREYDLLSPVEPFPANAAAIGS